MGTQGLTWVFLSQWSDPYLGSHTVLKWSFNSTHQKGLGYLRFREHFKARKPDPIPRLDPELRYIFFCFSLRSFVLFYGKSSALFKKEFCSSAHPISNLKVISLWLAVPRHWGTFREWIIGCVIWWSLLQYGKCLWHWKAVSEEALLHLSGPLWAEGAGAGFLACGSPNGPLKRDSGWLLWPLGPMSGHSAVEIISRF